MYPTNFIIENQDHLLPFSIADANKIMKGELDADVCTATGVKVRIICTDAKGDFPVIGLINYGNNLIIFLVVYLINHYSIYSIIHRLYYNNPIVEAGIFYFASSLLQ